MVAFPIKMRKEDSAISPLFGKAKYFAFYEDGELDIKVNPFGKGTSLIDWFTMKGVKNIVIKEIGMSPYQKIKETDMHIYYSGDEKSTIKDIIEKYELDCLEEIEEERLLEIIKFHEYKRQNRNRKCF